MAFFILLLEFRHLIDISYYLMIPTNKSPEYPYPLYMNINGITNIEVNFTVTFTLESLLKKIEASEGFTP